MFSAGRNDPNRRFGAEAGAQHDDETMWSRLSRLLAYVGGVSFWEYSDGRVLMLMATPYLVWSTVWEAHELK
jgi:hypothetical protein